MHGSIPISSKPAPRTHCSTYGPIPYPRKVYLDSKGLARASRSLARLDHLEHVGQLSPILGLRGFLRPRVVWSTPSNTHYHLYLGCQDGGAIVSMSPTATKRIDSRGQELWRFSINGLFSPFLTETPERNVLLTSSSWPDSVPRASRIHCLDGKTGKIIWEHDLAHVDPRFHDVPYHTAPSLLIDGKILFLMGHGAILLNRHSGEIERVETLDPFFPDAKPYFRTEPQKRISGRIVTLAVDSQSRNVHIVFLDELGMPESTQSLDFDFTRHQFLYKKMHIDSMDQGFWMSFWNTDGLNGGYEFFHFDWQGKVISVRKSRTLKDNFSRGSDGILVPTPDHHFLFVEPRNPKEGPSLLHRMDEQGELVHTLALPNTLLRIRPSVFGPLAVVADPYTHRIAVIDHTRGEFLLEKYRPFWSPFREVYQPGFRFRLNFLGISPFIETSDAMSYPAFMPNGNILCASNSGLLYCISIGLDRLISSSNPHLLGTSSVPRLSTP